MGAASTLFDLFDEIFPAPYRQVESGGHPAEFFNGMGVASTTGGKGIFFQPLAGPGVFMPVVSSVDPLDGPAQTLPDHVFRRRSILSERMGGNCHPAGPTNLPEHFIRRQMMGDVLNISENQEISVARAVFHAKNHTESVGLEPFGDIPPDVHALVISDAHAV
jgi:hypothetical protein